MATTVAPAFPYPRAIEEVPALRQSLLGTFDNCALSAGFDLRLSIDRGPGLTRQGYSSHRAAGGQLIHRTLARALRLMAEHGEEQIGADMLEELFEDEIRQADRDDRDLTATPLEEVRSARITLRKWARDNVITIANFIAAEERLEAVVHYPDGNGGTVPRVLTGQLDVLMIDPQDHATVIDWKDTWALPPKRRVAEDDLERDDAVSEEGYFQQRFYALLVFRAYRSVRTVTLREFYLRDSEPREATVWRHELPALEAEFSALAERFDRSYESELWHPSPGSHCSYCPLAAECPIEADAREYGAITTREQAEKAAGELLTARRVVASITRSLRAFCNHHGPVRVRDAKRERYFGWETSRRTERPTRAQVEQAVRDGRDPATLYRERPSSRFVDYTLDADDGDAPDDVVEAFEAAAAAARERRR